MNYTRTETHEGNECLITKDAHVVTVYREGSVVGYVATCSTIYYGWFGTDSSSQSCVFDDLDKAMDYCDKFFGQ